MFAEITGFSSWATLKLHVVLNFETSEVDQSLLTSTTYML